MTGWCIADWGNVLDSLKAVEWRVHITSDKDIWDKFAAIATPLIAVITGWIAYQQWRTSEKELKAKVEYVYMDCYYKTVEALYVFAHISFKSETAEVDLEKSGKLMIDAYGLAQLRLPQEVSDYVKHIRDVIFQAKGLRSMAYGVKPFAKSVPEKQEELMSVHLSLADEKPWEFFRKYVEKYDT